LHLKRTRLIVFCVFLLCSLLLIVNAGTVRSSEPGYSYEEYDSQVVPTIDGKWTSPDEWTDGALLIIAPNAIFEGKVTIATDTFEEHIVEIYSDNTNDTGDYWQFCFDTGNNGGTAPDSDDYRFDIVGHTTLVAYQGNGAGWTQLGSPPAGIYWANSIDSSPLWSTPHWILEFRVDKATSPITTVPPLGLRVAVYDASDAGQGALAWPPTSQDDPSRWGQISGYGGGPIPEGLSLGLALLLATAAVVVGSYFLRKRPKTARFVSSEM
jgi:hypothetical protein